MQQAAILRTLGALSLATAIHSTAIAADGVGPGTNTRVAFQPSERPAAAMPRLGDELILTSAPRETETEAQEIFGPVAAYLSQALGRKVSFQYSGNWGVYQGQMQKGTYDIAFDGAHFNGWRIKNIGHQAVVKIPGESTFSVIVREDESRVKEMKQLAGRTLCAHAPPNFGTLAALDQFDNPARQPVIVTIDGWKNIYQGLVAGRCVAAVVSTKILNQLEQTGGPRTREIFRSTKSPDNAISAGPRLSTAEVDRVRGALLAPAAAEPTRKLRERYAQGREFAPAENREFVGFSSILRNEWGY